MISGVIVRKRDVTVPSPDEVLLVSGWRNRVGKRSVSLVETMRGIPGYPETSETERLKIEVENSPEWEILENRGFSIFRNV